MALALGLAVALCLSLLLSGCSLGPDFARPMPWQPSDWHSLPAGNAAPVTVQPVDPRWWRQFHDPALETLEQEALAHNLDIAIATARLRAARAQREIAGAALWPVLNANASGEREQASQKGLLSLFGAGAGGAGSAGAPSPASTANGSFGSGAGGVPGSASFSKPVNLFQDGVDASWELDLFGGARRSYEAAGASLAASAANQRAAQLAVCAEVASAYVDLRRAQATVALLERMVRTAQDTEQLTDDRVRAGLASTVESAQAQAQSADLRAQLAAAKNAVAASTNALTVLLGTHPAAGAALLARLVPAVTPPASVARTPSDRDPGAELPETAVPTPTLPVPIGLPSEVVRRRPDILAAEDTLHAAVAQIGAAEADFYPHITLSASAGFQALELGDLSSWNAREFALGPTLSLPLFEGGRLSGTLELRRAGAQEAALNYQKTVLSAWQEVDNALAALAADAGRREALLEAAQASARALSIARDRYRRGLEPYLLVLDTERTLLSAEMQRIDGDAALATDAVTLYRAVGGGW